MLGYNAQLHVWRKPKSISAETLHTRCQGHWSKVMIRFVCLLCKPGNLAVIEWIVKSSVYQSTIQQMWGHMLDNCSLVNVTGQICNRIAEKDVQPSAWLLRDLRRAVKNNRNNTVKHSGTKLLDNMNNIVNLITLSKLRSRSLIFSRN